MPMATVTDRSSVSDLRQLSPRSFDAPVYTQKYTFFPVDTQQGAKRQANGFQSAASIVSIF
jgi:hypothetical protein